jgi:HEAT repeat protein
VVQYLKNALAVLTNKGDTEIWLLIGEKFAERLPKETHLPTYRELALSLSSHAVSLLRKRAFDKTQKFIKLLRKQALPESGVEIERRKVAEESLLSFSRDTIELLLNDLKSENSKRELGAHRILGILGERVIKYLVQMVKEAEDVRLREVVSSLLIELKDKAKWALLEELTPSVNYDEAQRILQVLASLQDEEILDHLSSPLTHPNPRVRAEVGKLLLKYGSEKAEKLLLQQLADESREVQNQAIKSLGELRSKRALPYLVKLLKVRDIGIKKELCQTFEKLGDETSLKSLIKLYGGRNVKWFGRREPLEVRVAAIWALKSFRRHEAKETLLKASQEKDISIQSAARRALEKLKEAL